MPPSLKTTFIWHFVDVGHDHVIMLPVSHHLNLVQINPVNRTLSYHRKVHALVACCYKSCRGAHPSLCASCDPTLLWRCVTASPLNPGTWSITFFQALLWASYWMWCLSPPHLQLEFMQRPAKSWKSYLHFTISLSVRRPCLSDMRHTLQRVHTLCKCHRKGYHVCR